MKTIATPLRAEEVEHPVSRKLKWFIVDNEGRTICQCYSKETAAAIVECVNGQTRSTGIPVDQPAEPVCPHCLGKRQFLTGECGT